MKWLGWPGREVRFADTPRGILTETHNWYHTREQLLHDYAGSVLEHEPLGRLLAQSDTWLRSPLSLAVWLLPLLLTGMPPVQAAMVVLVVYFCWQVMGPMFVSRFMLPFMRVLDTVLLQMLWYACMMTYLAQSGQFAALAVGVGSFVCLRWGVVAFVTRPAVQLLWGRMYRMPVTDHVLRACIVRAALHYGITLKDFAGIEQQIIQHLSRK